MPNLSTDGRENATFEAKKRQPKFNFRTLIVDLPLLEHHCEHSGDQCGSQRSTTPGRGTIAGIASALAVLDLGLAGLGRVHPSAMGKVQTVVTTICTVVTNGN